ncbi:unnamed protein product [Calicophoron daubneyi]|uniref:Conserved oligomeric Golgi complex subunit 2 n=1 Tax=Calicophoron daubneyi TaxID=300641 RepID=A0AAV2THV9_CALDB
MVLTEVNGLDRNIQPHRPTANFDSPGAQMTEKKRLLEDTFDITPSGLKYCFDRECFLRDDFQSNEFLLTQEGHGTSLEQIRDGLLQYSNILKSSLVELINQDYADFVNLSTNLVGLDKAIDSISTPLRGFENSVQSVITDLESIENTLTGTLKDLQILREKKELLNNLRTIGECVARLERWLTPTDSSSSEFQERDFKQNLATTVLAEENPTSAFPKSSDARSLEEDEDVEWPVEFFADCSLQGDSGQRIDRVANEYMKLSFALKKCQEHPVTLSMKSRIQWITSMLQEQLSLRMKSALEAAQLTSTKTKSTVDLKLSGEQLRHVLSTYLVIGKLSDFIQLYRKYALRPKLVQIFTPRQELVSRGSDPKRAAGVLDEVYSGSLNVLDEQLTRLNQLKLQRPSESYDPLAEFDCIVDAFWPETVDLICENLPDIFNAGDPDRFYALHTSTVRFLSTLEGRANSPKQVDALRNHPSYGEFLNKWSLPVYFQIRFQDIAGCVEKAMNESLRPAEVHSQGCFLHVTEVVIKQLERCWQDGIYLVALRHRFWKLTLQILSRYASFASHYSKPSDTTEKIKTNDGMEPATRVRHLDDGFEKLIFLIGDCYHLCDFVKSTLSQRILQVIGPLESDSDQSLTPSSLIDCLSESCDRLLSGTKPLEDALVDRVLRLCSIVSRLIQDVPRQYRRTNRNLPTTVSGYVSAMINPLTSLSNLASKASQNTTSATDSFKELVTRCVNEVANAYHSQLTELIISVRKMEDSLRKLREARRGTSTGNQVAGANSSTYSDDDKIRHQLYLDTCAFRDQVNGLWGSSPKCQDAIQKIVDLTENAKAEAASNVR